jgi:hypothetical protein
MKLWKSTFTLTNSRSISKRVTFTLSTTPYTSEKQELWCKKFDPDSVVSEFSTEEIAYNWEHKDYIIWQYWL